MSGKESVNDSKISDVDALEIILSSSSNNASPTDKFIVLFKQQLHSIHQYAEVNKEMKATTRRPEDEMKKLII